MPRRTTSQDGTGWGRHGGLICCLDNPGAKKEAKLGHSHHQPHPRVLRGRGRHGAENSMECSSLMCLTLEVVSTGAPEETEVQGL